MKLLSVFFRGARRKTLSPLILSMILAGCGIGQDSSSTQTDSAHEPTIKPSASLHGDRVRYGDRSSPAAEVEENSRFPVKPDPGMTPGQVCDHPTELRYPEKIKYCHRNVDPELKAQIFAAYDRSLGFHTREMDRQQFKIDHLIPLCMGGANQEDNLWPQHEKVYKLTDPIEPYLCEKMAAGRLKQEVAIRIIKEVKQEPNTTDARMAEVDRM